MIRFCIALLLLLLGAPAAAQMNYGGHAAPSMDLMLDITRDMTRDNAIRGLARQGGRSGLAAQPPGAVVASSSLFANALAPVGQSAGQSTAPAVDTRFTRNLAVQRQSEAGVLQQLRQRSPAAAADAARVFRDYDIARLFDKATAQYGFRNDDLADTMAAYWLVSWVIANDARDFSVPAARAVRDQVRAGIARTPVATYTPARKHQLADEAIINTLLATQMFEYAHSGKVPRDQYRRIGDDLQRTFLGFGTDLRNLELTDAGFRMRER